MRICLILSATLFAGFAAVSLGACKTAAPPPRGVHEANVQTWKYRRYQRVVDVEIWVPQNGAVGYTASYVHEDAERAGRLDSDDVVNAFVTRYDHDRGVMRALIQFARRLGESNYDVEVRSMGGIPVIHVSGVGESWALWSANRHIIKIGSRGRERIPEALIEAYAAYYPSRITGESLDGPLPPADGVDNPEGEPAYDPNNPTPDWEQYRPSNNAKSKRR